VDRLRAASAIAASTTTTATDPNRMNMIRAWDSVIVGIGPMSVMADRLSGWYIDASGERVSTYYTS
jgi:hypothetical protein